MGELGAGAEGLIKVAEATAWARVYVLLPALWMAHLVDALRLSLQRVLDAVGVVEDVGASGEVVGHAPHKRAILHLGSEEGRVTLG